MLTFSRRLSHCKNIRWMTIFCIVNQISGLGKHSIRIEGNMSSISFYFTLLLGVSHNEPKFCSNPSWNPNSNTFADTSIVGINPQDIFINTDNTVFVPNQGKSKLSYYMKEISHRQESVQVIWQIHLVCLPQHQAIFMSMLMIQSAQ